MRHLEGRGVPSGILAVRRGSAKAADSGWGPPRYEGGRIIGGGSREGGALLRSGGGALAAKHTLRGGHPIEWPILSNLETTMVIILSLG